MTKEEALVHREVGETILQHAASHLLKRSKVPTISDCDALAIIYSCQCLVELTDKREGQQWQILSSRK